MTGRKQRVEVNGHLSDFLNLTFDVPQGSILGPLLYILATIDLELWCTNSSLNTYADDTINSDYGHTLNAVITQLEANAEEMMNFMTSNGLKMNSTKTELLIFGPRRNVPAQLFIGGQVVQETDHFRL